MEKKRNSEPGPLTAGWRLLWQMQGVLWGVFAINLALGLCATLTRVMQMGGALDHRLAAERLYHTFDVAYFVELAVRPDVQPASRAAASLPYAAIFLIFMLFVTGGILQTYLSGQRFVAGDFFRSCGEFLWRFVRLLLWLIVILLPILALATGVSSLSSKLSGDSPFERLGFWVDVLGLALIGLVLMLVRLWFDMAQILTIAQDQRSMRHALAYAWRLIFPKLGSIFWIYLRLSLLAWAATGIILYVWVKFVPPERVGTAFLLGQSVAWLWLATRLWQRASEVAWYERNRPQPVPVATGTEQSMLDSLSQLAPPESPEMS